MQSAQSWLSNTTAARPARHLAPAWLGERGARKQPRKETVWDAGPVVLCLGDFCQFLETNSWSLETEMLETGN